MEKATHPFKRVKKTILSPTISLSDPKARQSKHSALIL